MDKVVGELDLSTVVHIATRLPGDNDDKARFYFEVHFSQGKGSPWILRTYTQVIWSPHNNNSVIVHLYEHCEMHKSYR